jgi:hypothetical protein
VTRDDALADGIVEVVQRAREALRPAMPEQYGPHKQLEIEAWRWQVFAAEVRDAYCEQTRAQGRIEWGLEARDVVDPERCAAWAQYRIDHASWLSKPENTSLLKAWHLDKERDGEPPGPRKPTFEDPKDVRGWRPGLAAMNVTDFLHWSRKRWLEQHPEAAQ